MSYRARDISFIKLVITTPHQIRIAILIKIAILIFIIYNYFLIFLYSFAIMYMMNICTNALMFITDCRVFHLG